MIRKILLLCVLGLAGCGSVGLPDETPGEQPIAVPQPATDITFFASYPSYEEITGFINRLAAQAPETMQVREIGRSVQGRPIYAVEIGSGKNALYMDAVHHGNEVITPMVALYFLRQLVTRSDAKQIRELLASTRFYLIPCVNPDGYAAERRVNANKVDPNRNYSEAWAESDPSSNESQNGGKAPFSEPETRAVSEFIALNIENIRIALTLHSGIDRIHYSKNSYERPTKHNYEIYTYLSETGRKLSGQSGCGMAGISPLAVAPTGGGRGTALSWLHSKGIYAFTVECYGDGVYPWAKAKKYYPPEIHIIDICKRWLAFNMFMLKSVNNPGNMKDNQIFKPQSVSVEERERKYINEALGMMENPNPGFKKDMIDDDYRLEIIQNSLHKPLELTDRCDLLDQNWREADTLSDALQIQAGQMGRWWTVTPTAVGAPAKSDIDSAIDKSPREFQPALKRILSAVAEANALLDKAFKDLSPEKRKYLIKNIIPEMYLEGDKTKDDFQIDAEAMELRLAAPGAKTVTAGRDEINPEEVAMLKLALDVNFGCLNQAGMLMASAVDDAIEMLAGLTATPTAPPSNKAGGGQVIKDIVFSADTFYGRIVIGGYGSNTYNEDALLIIDMGGNDRYLNRAGGVVPETRLFGDKNVKIVIDLSGDDQYLSDRKFSQGAGLFGIGILADLSGSDTYQAKGFSQGAGLFGIGMLADSGEGADTFSADTFCQGAGGWGIGILSDKLGDTKYYSRTFSQGLGYTLGAGALVDYAGDDYYISSGSVQNDRLYSMSQGFGQGQRPIASGGVGTLIDYQGNDHYSSYYYAQGCAYWYGLGILIDNSGNDRYDAQVYAQGCGIHLSTGVLIDRGGADFYNCTYGGNAQGAAHDLAVGVLVDKSGTDTYVGRGNNQGSAITNAFALFIDSSGDDVYHTTAKGGQGSGGAARGYGSIGIFLDLAGNDFYSEQYLNEDAKTGNNKKWLRGDKGAGIDTE
ncbi:MAG: M14 family metallopeptidase [Planctomycetota bacterium]